MNKPEVLSPTFERTLPPRSRGHRSVAAVALGLFLAGGAAAVANHTAVTSCDRQETMAPAFSFSPSDAQCDSYDTNVTSRVDAIVDTVIPNISIVDLPTFDMDNFKLFDQDS